MGLETLSRHQKLDVYAISRDRQQSTADRAFFTPAWNNVLGAPTWLTPSDTTQCTTGFLVFYSNLRSNCRTSLFLILIHSSEGDLLQLPSPRGDQLKESNICCGPPNQCPWNGSRHLVAFTDCISEGIIHHPAERPALPRSRQFWIPGKVKISNIFGHEKPLWDCQVWFGKAKNRKLFQSLRKQESLRVQKEKSKQNFFVSVAFIRH